ncbi:MAG: hypothetical protein OK439_06345 [Thaumarchaeota archaeon]|nr:hypothetical protein [Nitrososphaerota archaeon]
MRQMPAKVGLKTSKICYVPSAVSSFFEICDRNPDGTKIRDPLQIGARGGGFKLQKGNITQAVSENTITRNEVEINGKLSPVARTSLRVIELVREKYDFPPVKILHKISPPIGSGFGTSGAGALGTAIALGDLFNLHFTLSEAAGFAHIAEIQSVTGLGTVLSLASGGGAIGLVTEPGSYSVGRTDAILSDYDKFVLVCASFGPIEKSTILSKESARRKVNEFGRKTLENILKDPTPESLLRYSREFSEKAGLASRNLLKLSDKAVELGAIGATPNMIGNAIHCLVLKTRYENFSKGFSKLVPKKFIFESELVHDRMSFV